MFPPSKKLPHILLILTGTVLITWQEIRRPTWRQYVDAMCATCISQEGARVSIKLTTLLRCLIAQRDYLQCDSSTQILGSPLTTGSTSLDIHSPCALIYLPSKMKSFFTTRQWRITAYSQLYLNLTFLEFALPMPYARCDRYQASENLLVSHQNTTLNRNLKDSVFLCGEHSPFSMVWRYSRVLLVYTREISATQVGNFRIQYQVCDQTVTAQRTQTVHHAFAWKRANPLSLRLSTIPSFDSRQKHVMYAVHLLGSRLTQLDILFAFQGEGKQHFHVDAFDGPGPAELHRRLLKHQALDSEWILFDTFQAYMHIACKRYHCGGIFLMYKWSSALPNTYQMRLSKGINLTTSVVSRLCSHSHRWYCLFEIGTSILQNVEISLQVVDFSGPDYLGGFNKSHNCLLAGVTITDGYRATFMTSNESLFTDLGDIPRDLAVDSVLPEITTCFDVPLALGDRVIWDFPINTFVSYGPTLILVIYAYGAYIDLNKSHIRLVMRPSHSAGLIVSCPSIVSDGFLGIGAAFLSGRKAISEVKQSACPFENILYVKLTSLAKGRSKALTSDLIICNNQHERLTTVILAPLLSDQPGSGVVQSLLVQVNSYTLEMKMDCRLIVEDMFLHQSINYNVHIRVPEIIDGAEYFVVATSSTKGFLSLGQRQQLTGQYLKLQVIMVSTYISVKLNASLPCTEAVQLLADSDKKLQRHLHLAGNTHRCQSYMIPMWNNNHKHHSIYSYNTHLIYLSNPYYLKLLQNIITRKAKMGRLTALLFTWDMCKFLFIANITLHGACSHLCKHARVQIAYRTLVSHNIISLEWNLILTRRTSQITFSDMPMSGVLLYITSLNDKCIEKVCSANIEITETGKNKHMLSIWDDHDSGQIPFVEYQLLWTHKEYTWNEAEEICRHLGGMHGASISSETEYLLITRMLLGSAYHVMDTDQFRLPILSPCSIGSPLCVIYIGLRRQNASFSWSDGRPTGYLRWNANYFRGHGPHSVKYQSQNDFTNNRNVDRLLMEARSVLQPQYSNETLCTVLIGSPGPHDMEFVSVPCDRKLKVSSVMCIKGGKELEKERPLYRLTHLKLKAKDSQLVTNTTGSHFNVDTLYEALVKGKEPPENQGSSGFQLYFETLNDETYSKQSYLRSQELQQVWNQSIQSCSNLNHTIDLCDHLWPYNETSTNNIQSLSNDLFITKLDHDIRNTSLSVRISNYNMIASAYCASGAVFDGIQCLRLFQKAPDSHFLTLDELCQRDSNKTHVYVYSDDSNRQILLSILRRLDMPREQASCHNEQGDTIAFYLNSDKLEFRVYEQGNPATNYVVCSFQPTQSACPSAYFTCDNGCISEQFLCDGKVHCNNEEDEQNCTHLCKALDASPRYCRTTCLSESCTCHELYFQCSSGGCIHSSKICNGVADCINAEDESFCFGLTSLQHIADTTNDFIPDLEDSSDEKIYINLLNSVQEEAADSCGSMQQVPCIRGHPACYSIDKMCLYDYTEDGRLKYCRNALHLLNCEYFQCSGSFKCRHSYCIPTHRVCDGVQDCPYGDDEITCPLSACINMLRCGQTCVHPSAICDGSVQCMFGEDELVCGAPRCPPACQCSGYAMKCHTLMTFHASFNRLTILILRDPKIVLTKELFRHVTFLLILDISYCNVTSISNEGPFSELDTLIKLDLSHNAVRSTPQGSLDGLDNLIKLDLSWNPLSFLALRTFAHMSRLQVLSLQHCHLAVVSDNAASNTQSLDILDLSFGGKINIGCLSLKVTVLTLIETTIYYHKDHDSRCWKDVNRVISNQRGICCLRLLQEKCDDGWKIKQQKCLSLFQSRILFVYCCILIVVIATCNFCVFIYKLVIKSTDAILICNLALANIFIVVPLCNFVNWHVLYDTEFAFFEPIVSRSVHCRISGDVLVIFTQTATFFQALISLQKYYGIVSMCNVLTEHKTLFCLLISTAWLSSVFVCTFLRFQDEHEAQTTTMVKGLFYYYDYKHPIWLAFFVLALLFALTSIFSYTRILKYIYETRVRCIGIKHGRDTVLSSIIRVSAILFLSNVSVLAVLCLTTCLFLTTTEPSQAVTLIVLIFPLPSVFNPFIFTLSTRRFVNDCKNLSAGRFSCF